MDYQLNLLLATDRSFSRLSKEKGAATAFSRFLTKDAIMLPHNQNPVIGLGKICKAMDSGGKEVLTWDPQGGKIDPVGNMGFTWRFYTVKLESGKEIYGKYLNIWMKQPDGLWKVLVDMGNGNPKYK